jgi:hypothetical protein
MLIVSERANNLTLDRSDDVDWKHSVSSWFADHSSSKVMTFYGNCLLVRCIFGIGLEIVT